MIIALTPGSVDLPVDGVWPMSVLATDSDGVPVDAAVTFTVTQPDGTPVVVPSESPAFGVFRADVVLLVPGRFVARATTAAYGAVDFVAYATAVVPAPDMPDLDACKVYLGIDVDDTTRDVDVQSALDAESSAQRDRCRVPAAYPPSLREALLRRVARNLALRALPLAVLRGDGEAGDTVLPGADPEIKRLEAPYRKRVMG